LTHRVDFLAAIVAAESGRGNVLKVTGATMRMRTSFFAMVMTLMLPAAASASQVFATSYDMNNGDSGTYTYHDNTYNGSGDPNVDNSYLSGGLGMLTDGVIATSNWYITPQLYVGWNNDPLIKFHFAGAVAFTDVRIYVDDSGGAGGVAPPSSVAINGTNYAFGSNPNPVAPYYEDFNITGLNTNELDIQLFRSDVWVFVSEVSFFGGAAVPEPSTFTLLAAGLGVIALTGIARRRIGRP
jgi:hypothetical protein